MDAVGLCVLSARDALRNAVTPVVDVGTWQTGHRSKRSHFSRNSPRMLPLRLARKLPMYSKAFASREYPSPIPSTLIRPTRAAPYPVQIVSTEKSIVLVATASVSAQP